MKLYFISKKCRVGHEVTFESSHPLIGSRTERVASIGTSDPKKRLSSKCAECKTSQPRFIMMSFVLKATCGLTLSRSNFTERSPLHSIRSFSFQFLAQGRLIDVGTSSQ